MKTVKKWAVLTAGGNLAGGGFYNTRRTATYMAECFNRSAKRLSGPYTACRVTITYEPRRIT